MKIRVPQIALNCGTGAGGFQSGNTCASGGGGGGEVVVGGRPSTAAYVSKILSELGNDEGGSVNGFIREHAESVTQVETDWAESIPERQRTAVNKWTKNHYKGIRRCQETPSDCDEEHGQVLMELDDALATAPVYKGTTYRGMTVQPKFAKSLTPGTTFELKAHSSFSTSEQVAKGFAYPIEDRTRVMIVCEKSKARSIRGVEQAITMGEQEVIGTAGTKLRVKRTEHDKKNDILRVYTEAE